MAKDEVTLFAELSPRSLELKREIQKTGLSVHLVFSAGVPYVESRLATIRGYDNIRRFFVGAPAAG
ncbi:MAG TPA: hypothetical protein VFS30_14705 [Dehalococcoidia bacterium]|nr:hypothetical protein [Dehalococcoidia bacterium]